MSWIEALILGLVQGFTEFLPVSSSGHLELGKALFDLNLAAKDSLTFDVIVHGGTALSTIVVFRKDILEIIKGLTSFKLNDEFKFALKIVLSMIPAAIVGVMYDDIIETSQLCVPHKYMHERMFVLTPLNSIAPDMLHPKYNKTVEELLQICKDTELVKEYAL